MLVDRDHESLLNKLLPKFLNSNFIPALMLICLSLFTVIAFVIIRGMPERLSEARCAGHDQVVEVGTTVLLIGNGEKYNSGRVDPDGDTLNYQWDLVLKPNGSNAELINPNSAETKFVADVVGTYTVALEIKDFKGCYPSEWVKVTSKPKEARLIPGESVKQADAFGPNERPVAEAGPAQIVIMPNGIYLDGKGSYDPDGHTLTYSWTLRRPDGTQDYLSETVAYRFRPEAAGIYEATLTVCDGILCDTDSVIITTTGSSAD